MTNPLNPEACRKCLDDMVALPTREGDPEGIRHDWWCPTCRIVWGSTKGARFALAEQAPAEGGTRVPVWVGPFHDDESGFGIEWRHEGKVFTVAYEAGEVEYVEMHDGKVVESHEWKCPCIATLQSALADKTAQLDKVTAELIRWANEDLGCSLSDDAHAWDAITVLASKVDAKDKKLAEARGIIEEFQWRHDGRETDEFDIRVDTFLRDTGEVQKGGGV